MQTLSHVDGTATSSSAGNEQKGTGSSTGSNASTSGGKSKSKLINEPEMVFMALLESVFGTFMIK